MKSKFVKLDQRTLRLACASAFAASGLFASMNSLAASQSADATATVIVPIAIGKTADLAFGKFAAGASGGNVVMTTAGGRSGTGTIVLSTVTPGNAASFAVTGDSNATYAITLPGSATLSDGASGNMTVGTFTSNPSGTGTLTSGAQVLLVGGTLLVGAAQTAGVYTGTFSVAVEYN